MRIGVVDLGHMGETTLRRTREGHSRAARDTGPTVWETGKLSACVSVIDGEAPAETEVRQGRPASRRRSRLRQ